MRKNLKVKVALQDSISLSIPAQHSTTFLLFNISMKFLTKDFFSSAQHSSTSPKWRSCFHSCMPPSTQLFIGNHFNHHCHHQCYHHQPNDLIISHCLVFSLVFLFFIKSCPQSDVGLLKALPVLPRGSIPGHRFIPYHTIPGFRFKPFSFQTFIIEKFYLCLKSI